MDEFRWGDRKILCILLATSSKFEIKYFKTTQIQIQLAKHFRGTAG